MTASNRCGLAAFLAFLACIPLANWMIGHVGTFCVPQGPCLIPVAPGLTAPSGVMMVGFALVFRDLVQRLLGRGWGLLAVLVGTALSILVAQRSLVAASGLAFLLSELADYAVYTPLQKRGLMLAVLASSMVGLVVDSVLFLGLAFGSLEFLEGQIVGKIWAVLISIPLIQAARRLAPAPA
jgi:queuosine precursor transporter